MREPYDIIDLFLDFLDNTKKEIWSLSPQKFGEIINEENSHFISFRLMSQEDP
jgi:hypothetical protein